MGFGQMAGAQRNYASDGVDIFIWERRGLGGQEKAVADPVTMSVVKVEDFAMLRPCVTLSMESAQMLIDELWNAGLRPRYAQATDQTTAALTKHIDDLRELAGRLLGLQEAKK